MPSKPRPPAYRIVGTDRETGEDRILGHTGVSSYKVPVPGYARKKEIRWGRSTYIPPCYYKQPFYCNIRLEDPLDGEQ